MCEMTTKMRAKLRQEEVEKVCRPLILIRLPALVPKTQQEDKRKEGQLSVVVVVIKSFLFCSSFVVLSLSCNFYYIRLCLLRLKKLRPTEKVHK